MKYLSIILLLVSNLVLAETPEERVQLYFNDLAGMKFNEATSHIEPSELKSFRDMMSFYRGLPVQVKGQFITSFFGEGQTEASVDTLSDQDFFAAFLGFVMSQAQAMGGLNFDNVEILGGVPEGSNVVHLVTRNKVSVGAISIEGMEIVSLKQIDNRWYIQLSGEIKGLPEQFKMAFGGA